MNPLTRKEYKFIYKHTGKLSIREIARQLNRSDTFVRREMDRWGLQPSKEVCQEFSNQSLFKKKSRPWNKDVKGLHNSPGTQFKKGHVSQTKKEVGYLYKNKGYWLVKMEQPHRFENLAHVIYTVAVGPIGEGELIKYRDGNTDNVWPDNLELITRKDNMLSNTYHRYPKEIATVIHLRGVLNRQINKRTI